MTTNKYELDSHQQAFFELVRAGLWEKDVCLLLYGKIDFSVICAMAEKQGVLGLIAAGLEHADVKPSQVEVLNIVGSALKVEQRNKAMNQFVAELVEKMCTADINAILVKGQGVAQCYARPLWRPSGDVDFLLSEDNYKKAISFFRAEFGNSKNGGQYSKEYVFYSDKWMIELHGSLRSGLSASVDREIDAVQNNVFLKRKVRSWMNGKTQVFLPAPNEDVFLVFTHFIKHFYKEGMNLRQVCDWCRLLYTYHSDIDDRWLEKHLRKAGLIDEWNVFATLSIDYLGMQKEAMPVLNLSDNVNLKKKAVKLMSFILKGYSGNKAKDTWQIAKIFPWKALRYAPSIFLNVNWMKIKERIFKR